MYIHHFKIKRTQHHFIIVSSTLSTCTCTRIFHFKFPEIIATNYLHYTQVNDNYNMYYVHGHSSQAHCWKRFQQHTCTCTCIYHRFIKITAQSFMHISITCQSNDQLTKIFQHCRLVHDPHVIYYCLHFCTPWHYPHKANACSYKRVANQEDLIYIIQTQKLLATMRPVLAYTFNFHS